MKIFIVEDEPEIRLELKALLEMHCIRHRQLNLLKALRTRSWKQNRIWSCLTVPENEYPGLDG